MYTKEHAQNLGRRMMGGGLAAITLFAILAVTRAGAQDPDTAVRTDPLTLQIAPGKVVTLNVMLVGAQEVYGIDVRATFDPQLVEVVDADPAKDGIQMSPGTFPQPDFVARNVADNEAGSLRYAITQINPTDPVTGSGVVLSVQLRAKASTGESDFAIGPVDLVDRNGQTLRVRSETGVVRVVPAAQATPEPADTAVQTEPADAAVQITPTDGALQTMTPGAPTQPPAALASKPLGLLIGLAILASVALALVSALMRRRKTP